MKENNIQRDYFNSIKLLTLKYPELVFVNSSSNGAVVSIRQAIFLKQMGLRNGFPDCFLPFPDSTFHGTFIEFKNDKGRQSKYQKLWERYLLAIGYNYVVCRSAKSALDLTIELIENFRKLTNIDLKEIKEISKEYQLELLKK